MVPRHQWLGMGAGALCLLCAGARAQFLAGGAKFNQVRQAEEAALNASLRASVSVSASYRFDPPLEEDYRIGLIVDPCRGLAPDCCMGVYGTAQYQASTTGAQADDERVVKTVQLASDDVAINYRLVFEDGLPVPDEERRSADDEPYMDSACEAEGVPHARCKALHFAYRPSPLRHPCSDNNASVDALAGCAHPNGSRSALCVAVGYSQNAFIAQCRGDPAGCGTFIEVHQPRGSPYQSEEQVLGEAHLDALSVSGYSTLAVPLSFAGNRSRVLCAYSESFLRVGSLVYVMPGAPVCCCPRAYSSSSRRGSFHCPAGAGGRGAFASALAGTAHALIVDNALGKHPYCQSGLEAADSLMCSVLDAANGWPYSRPCLSAAPLSSGALGSRDLAGQYQALCPFLDACGLQSGGACAAQDAAFSFVGRVGRVVALDQDQGAADVTFNDGRTAYRLQTDHLRIEPAHMYELWWVQRAQGELIVRKRKGLRVAYPPCTFDPLRQRYFPFAELDSQGRPLP